MAQDDENVMRNALDAVDRGRKWALVGVVALFVGTAFALFASFHISATVAGSSEAVGGPREPAGVPLQTLFVIAVAQMLFVLCCAAVVMIHVTRMTKSILRAIDAKAR